MKTLVLVALLCGTLAPRQVRTQGCTAADAHATVGRSVLDASEARFNADAIRKLRSTAPALAAQSTRVMTMLQTMFPAPAGAEIKIYHTVNTPRSLAGTSLVRTEVAAYLFSYYCVPIAGYDKAIAGRVILGEESDGDIHVFFNSLGPLANDLRQVRDLRTARRDVIYFAAKQRDVLGGVPVYRAALVPTLDDAAIVLTLNDRSPWIPLSRAAFLEARIFTQQAQLDSLRARIAAVPALLDTLRSKGAVVSARMDTLFGTSQSGRNQLAVLERALASLRAARDAMSADDRASQAVVADPYAPPSTLFVSEDGGGTPLVVIDRSFYRPGTAPDAVHLITVSWKWTPDDKAVTAVIRQFREQLDVQALRRMLTP